MASLLRRIAGLVRRPPAPPRVFDNPNFPKFSADSKVEEETFSDYLAARYYPVRIGEVFASKYQVVRKLGYGAYSTVWLARDLNQHRHVALKVFIRSQSIGPDADHELKTYQHIARVSSASKHPGRRAVRTLLDSFQVTGPDGEHHCLVHPPLWDSVQDLLRRNPIGRLPTLVLGIVLQRLFMALDFLHTECHLVHTDKCMRCPRVSILFRAVLVTDAIRDWLPHTDLKLDNIMFGCNGEAVFQECEQEELERPSPRKEVDGRVIYLSRQLNVPKDLAVPVLCDFGSVVSGEHGNATDVQPDLYRAPEVILEVPWSYEIDIWNVGCMIWDMFEGGRLFSGRDPEHHTYRGRAHLASIIGLLGPPPPAFVARGPGRTWLIAYLWTYLGKFNAGIQLPPPRTLEELETNLRGKDKEAFLHFMGKMLQWDPARRSTAKELLQDAWLKGQL